MGEHLATVLEMEVADPTPYSGVDFSYYLFKRLYRHLTVRNNGDTILDRLQGDGGISIAPDTEYRFVTRTGIRAVRYSHFGDS